MIRVGDRVFLVGRRVDLEQPSAEHRRWARRTIRLARLRRWLRRWWWRAALVALVAAAAAVAWWHLPLSTVTVAVTGTAPAALDGKVRTTITNALQQLEGVTTVPAHQVVGSSPAAVELATGAEVLVYTVTEERGSYQVNLVRGSRTASFAVPTAALGSTSLLHDALAGYTRSLFDRRRAAGRPLLDIDPAAWDAYLDLRRSELQPSDDLYWERYLRRLEAHLSTYPGNIDARVKAAGIARYLFQRDQDPQQIERAWQVLGGAELADPRLIYAAADLAVSAGETGRAEQLLAALPVSYPGRAWIHSRIAAQRRDFDEQLQALEAAVAAGTAPRWWHLLTLGQAELELGRFADARATYERVLAVSPGNLNGRAGIALVELYTGDPAAAMTQYEELARTSPQPDYFWNIAAAQMLLGNYHDALASFRKAESLGLTGPMLFLNRADCYSMLDGRPARRLYTHVLELTKAAADLDGSWKRAKAFASLGKEEEALEIVASASPGTPFESYSLYDIYTRLGRPEAGQYADQAMRAGFSKLWFDLSRAMAVVAQDECKLRGQR